MAGGVDQVQNVVGVTDAPWQPNVLRLDGDPALPLDIHPVEVLGAHIPVGDHTGQLQHPVGQRRLPVINVSDDAEVPNLRRRGERPVGETADGNLLVSGTRVRVFARGSRHAQRIDTGASEHNRDAPPGVASRL